MSLKSTITAFSLFFLSAFCLKISAQQLAMQDIAQRFYDTARPTKVVSTSDGGFLMLESANFSFAGAIKIKKLNMFSNVVWQKDYSFPNAVNIGNMLETNDGGILLGGTFEINSKETDYMLIKLNNTGDILWNKNFGGLEKENIKWLYGQNIIELDNGHILLGGTSRTTTFANKGDKQNPGLGKNDYWILKLDAQGNKLWDRVYGGIDEEYFGGMTFTSDGFLVIIGYSKSGIGSSKSALPGPWVLKVDPYNGNIVWDITFQLSNEDILHGAKDLTIINVKPVEGGFILGNTIDFISPSPNLMYIKNDGTIVWYVTNKTDYFGQPNNYGFLRDLLITPNNEILMLAGLYGFNPRVEVYDLSGNRKYAYYHNLDMVKYNQTIGNLPSNPGVWPISMAMSGSDKLLLANYITDDPVIGVPQNT